MDDLDNKILNKLEDNNQNILLSTDFIRKLQQLSVVINKSFAGKMRGERRSLRKGSSVEFADFRNYVFGDDLRYVDWNAYARLEKLFIKLFIEEDDVTIHLLLDTSSSMDFGTPTKLHYGKQICAALGYIALCKYDRVCVTAITDRSGPRIQNIRGRGKSQLLFSWLQSLIPSGGTDVGKALKEYASTAKSAGPILLISDCMSNDVDLGLKALSGRRFSPSVMQLLSREEVMPSYAGDLKLVDSETGTIKEITVTPGLLKKYQNKLDGYLDYLQGICNKYGINYINAVTDSPIDDLILNTFRQRGMLD
jgi:uncharacterized protein (DUF58 family)